MFNYDLKKFNTVFDSIDLLEAFYYVSNLNFGSLDETEKVKAINIIDLADKFFERFVIDTTKVEFCDEFPSVQIVSDNYFNKHIMNSLDIAIDEELENFEYYLPNLKEALITSINKEVFINTIKSQYKEIDTAIGKFWWTYMEEER